MSAAHLRAVVYLIERTLAGLHPARETFTRTEVEDLLLDLHIAVQSAYMLESLGLTEAQRLPRRLRRDSL